MFNTSRTWVDFAVQLVNWLANDAAAAIQAQASHVSEPVASEASKEAVKRAAEAASEGTKKLWRRVNWSASEEKYKTRLLDSLLTTRILGFRQPILINEIYTDISVLDYKAAQERTRQYLNPEFEQDHSASAALSRRSATEVVESEANLYILGHPGAGKTTLLKHLAISCCDGRINKLPLYVPLRDLRDSTSTLIGYLENEVDSLDLPEHRMFLRAVLANGKCLVLVDGLDEITTADSRRQKLIDELRSLIRRYPKSQYCVTCRIAASEYTFENLTYAELAPFNLQQQQSFIRSWFSKDLGARDHILGSWTAPQTSGLRDLARTPLLLALICLTFDDLKVLPERHIDLYRDAFDALMRRWDATRNISRDEFYEKLPHHRREQLLQEIAGYAQANNKIIFQSAEVAPIVSGWFAKQPSRPTHSRIMIDELLAQIEAQHGLIIQRAGGRYSFSHLSFQEFLTAKSIAEGHPARTIASVAKRYALNPRWREVFIFLAGLLPDATLMLELLRDEIAGSLPADDPIRMALIEVETFSSRIELAEDPAGGWSLLSPPELDRLTSDPLGQLLVETIERLRLLEWSPLYRPLVLRLQVLARQVAQTSMESTGLSVGAAQHSRNQSFRQQQQQQRPLQSGFRDSLLRYLQGTSLLLECAIAATCDNRVEVVASAIRPR